MNRQADQLASLLLDHVSQERVVDLQRLSRNPQEALGDDPSIQLSWVPPESLPPGCSIAATYDPTTSPASIRVAQDASAGRRRFSLLHEYAHHLREQVLEVLEVLFRSPQADVLTERMCDAFASRVLIPDSARQVAFQDGVRARAVATLMESTSASAQAVAVAAAESMDEPGYVVLLNSAGEAKFAARAGDVFPARRGTPQRGLLERAAGGAFLTGVASLDLGGGRISRELNTETAPAGRYFVAVMVDGPAPWTRFSGGRATFVPAGEGWCEECSEAFTSYRPACEQCGDLHCPTCGSCGCDPGSVAGERECAVCYTVQPPAAFETAQTNVCVACS